MVFVLLLAILEVAVHVISRTEWFNTRVTHALQQALGRDIQLGNLGAHLNGIFVEDIKVAEKDGFANGTFLEAGRLRVRISLWHLLYGHTKIDVVALSHVTLRARITPDGTASWADLLTSDTTAPKQESATGRSFPLHITAQKVILENLHIIYMDATVPRTLDVDELTVRINRFSLHEPFTARIYAQMRPTFRQTRLYIPLSAKLTVDLKNLDLEHATAELHSFTAKLQSAVLHASGRLENLLNPQLDVKLSLQNLSNDTLANIVTLPPFDLKAATAHIKAVANLEKKSVTLHHLLLKAPGAEIQAKGGLLYANLQQPKYAGSAEASLVLGEMGRWLSALAEPYQLVGTVQLSAQATQQEINARVNLEDVGAHFPQTGRIANVNAQLNVQETLDFKTGNAQLDTTGKLNGRPFTLALQANQKPQAIDVNLRLNAEELALLTQPSADPKPAQEQTQTPKTPAHTPWPLPPVHVKADVQLGRINVPYFEGNQVAFTANMQNLTPALNQAEGNLHLKTEQGTIEDIYKLTNANPLTKVLFLSLNLTGKVFNSLNVLGVLRSIGGGITDAVTGKPEEKAEVHTQTILGPDGEPLEVTVPASNTKTDGEMPYDTLDTEINFVHGIATIKKGSFVSPMMSLRIDGTTDFNTQAVDLTVRAAPGRHEVDGMMPLTLKISGTIDNPQGNMQLLGSMGALVTQGVTNNVVSRHVKKSIKGFFGLFKKDKEEEPQ